MKTTNDNIVASFNADKSNVFAPDYNCQQYELEANKALSTHQKVNSQK